MQGACIDAVLGVSLTASKRRTWKRNSVAGRAGPTVPVWRMGGGSVKNDAAHLHRHPSYLTNVCFRPAMIAPSVLRVQHMQF